MRALPIYDSLICFGDSLTQQASQVGGFVASLQDTYQRKLEVVSRGFSGYTSRQALALCPTLFAPGKSEQGTSAKLALIWLGSNDSIAPGYDQHVPIEEFKSNMTSIVQDYFTSTDVILITPGTVVPGKFKGHEDDKSMVEYGQALVEVAKIITSQRQAKGEGEKVEVLNMNSTFLEAAKVVPGGLPALLTEDGVHINQAGYAVVFKAIQQAISTHFPHLDPGKLPLLFPHWSDLDLSADQAGQKKQLQAGLSR